MDLSPNVSRSLRAVDGAIVVVDAVEEIQVQTETVLRMALKEFVKPVLFINKIDRLINELKFSLDEIQNKMCFFALRIKYIHPTKINKRLRWDPLQKYKYIIFSVLFFV